MKILILLFNLLWIIPKQEGNTKVTDAIVTSKIPEDCKLLFLAVTIKESGWHNNKRAVKKNNYSGFIGKNGKLLKFKSLKSYVKYTEKWFKRKHIKDNKKFHNYLMSGKYARFKNVKTKLEYMYTLYQIKNQISNTYNVKYYNYYYCDTTCIK